MTLNLTIKSLVGEYVNVIQSFYGKIQHTSAFLTDKMIMRSRISIKAVRPDTGCQFLDLADISKQ